MISLKGSTLSIKGFGTARIEIVILCILLGAFLCCNVFCTCCKSNLLGEGFGTKLSELKGKKTPKAATIEWICDKPV